MVLLNIISGITNLFSFQLSFYFLFFKIIKLTKFTLLKIKILAKIIVI